MEIVKNLMNIYFDFHYGIGCVIGITIFGTYLYLLQKMKRSQGQSISKKEVLCGLALSIYLVFLVGGTLLNRTIEEEYQIELGVFWSYREVFATHNRHLAWQMFYNVLAFIPWGFLIPGVWKKMQSFRRIVGSAVIASGLIELLQLVFKCGLFEFDDVFHNVIGAMIGYGIWLKIRGRMRIQS